MKERVKFVLEWEKRWNDGEGLLNFSELCREFGVSRQVGYDWVNRYREARFDVEAVKERSRRPRSSPMRVSDDVEAFLVAARKARPTWGPKKLRAWLAERYPKLAELPAQSTIGEVLRRRGLTVSRRRRTRATQASTQPFAEISGPNATGCVDFKGHFRTQDGRVCYPLTIVDAYSRFLIRCEGVEEPNGREVQRIFERTFDFFRKRYNEERPHEALGQKPPTTCFTLSARRYPCPLVQLTSDAPWDHAMRVDKDGFIRWREHRLFISRALAHEDVALTYVERPREEWLVTFGPLCVGCLRETPMPMFVPTKGRMTDQIDRERESEKLRKVSGMSPD